jgi:hypothetical protein
MRGVTKEEFKSYFSNRWYTAHKGFFEGSKRFIIDGHYVGFSDEEDNVFKLDYTIINKHKL